MPWYLAKSRKPSLFNKKLKWCGMHKVYSICTGAAVWKEWGDVVWSRVRETELVY